MPNKLDLNRASGSQIRPYKMKTAFESLGYKVDFVEGYGNDRKKAIKEIKRKIIQGVRYDFLYSESSTMPTLLTEKNHIPIYPDLDFGFFSFCKKRRIPIGLFYRDFHWKFPFYGDSVTGIKKIVALMAYRYDLIRYEQLLDRFFLSSDEAGKYFKNTKLENITRSLPPGADAANGEVAVKHSCYHKRMTNGTDIIKLFYVGGLGGHYQIEKMMSSVSKVSDIELTVCCREGEWQNNAGMLDKYLSDRINVVHKKGDELITYFRDSDICLACFEHSEYMDMAMPIKVFEYLSYAIPVIATKDTATGRFVSNNDIGWVVDYSEDSIVSLLEQLKDDYSKVVDKHENAMKALIDNTWESRASTVIEELVEDSSHV